MRKLSFHSIFLAAMAMILSCTTDKVKTFAQEFATAVANGDRAAITRMYPDAAKADSLSFTFNADSVTVTTDEANHQSTVTIGGGKDFTVSEDADGNLLIQSSHGLFAYPAHELTFAKRTGQWKAGLTDAEQAERMADHGLADYLFEQFNNQLKGSLTIANSATYGNDYFEGEWVSAKGVIFHVKNASTTDIPGSAWSITYKEGYWGGGKMATEEVPGVDVAAGATVTVRTQKLGSSMESETSERLNIKGLSREEFMAVFQPTGNEYDEYVKNHGKTSPAVGESLFFVVEGLMGGCDTRLSLNNESGTLMYTTNGKETDAGEKVNRDIKLLSYDPATGQLVLQVSRPDGTVTGKLVGIYRDGEYKGEFRNVNGKSSSFAFK